MSLAINPLAEGFDADAAHSLDEFLAILATLDIDIEHARNGLGNGVLGDRGTDDLAQRGDATDRAADGDLIPLDPVLVDAEDADVADMVMPAGIHAAGHLDLDV